MEHLFSVSCKNFFCENFKWIVQQFWCANSVHFHWPGHTSCVDFVTTLELIIIPYANILLSV